MVWKQTIWTFFALVTLKMKKRRKKVFCVVIDFKFFFYSVGNISAVKPVRPV